MTKQPRIVNHLREVTNVKDTTEKKGNSKEIDNVGNKNTLRI